MKILIDNNGVVFHAENEITLTETEASCLEWVNPYFNTSNATIVDTDVPTNFIGGAYKYINGEFVVHDQALIDEHIAEQRKALVPNQVSPRQARLALLQATLLDEVELLLANDKAMQIWWEYSLDIQRNHPHIITMGMALGMTETQLDELFILAGSL